MTSGPDEAGPEPDRPRDIRSYGRGILAAMPGAAVLAFDDDLRVSFSEGDAFRLLGSDSGPLEGRILPDVLPAATWQQLREQYEGALAGRTSIFDVATGDELYAVRVSPLVFEGTTRGALSVARAVTEQRRLESVVSEQGAAARDSARLQATAFDRAPIGMSVAGLDGRYLRVNAAYCRLFGYEREELLATTFYALTHPDDIGPDDVWRDLAMAGETDTLEREKRMIAKDGSTVWVDVRTEMVRDDEDRPAFSVSLLQDITERRQSEQDLRTSERRLRAILDNTPDVITVKDRGFCYQLVNKAFEQRFGLSSAEVIGRSAAEILPPATVAIERATDDEVLRTGETIEQEEVVPLDGEDRTFATVKFPLRDEGAEIYAVCGIFKDVTERRRRERDLQERLTWTDLIHNAVTQNRLVLHAQPILHLETGRVEQAELLIRMHDQRQADELVPPGTFLPAAERLNLVGVIDQWVVARAIEVARHRRVEVNLSGRTISDAAQVAAIERLVAEGGAPPENLIFEITETAVAENLPSAARFARRLRELGCSFALDDFGVGFGTFTYLKHLPVDFLKIDIEFVRELVRVEADRQVVSAIVGVARDFGMSTIAEGVEDQETLELLGVMGVDYAQGYWVGRPGPVEVAWPAMADEGRTG